MKKMRGVITAMVTPFDGAGNVDIKAARGLTRFLIAKGVDCLYPAGTTGEMYLMSVDERKKLAEAVIEENAGRATVYIHVGAMTLEDTVALARHAKDAGADGIGAVTPSYFSVNEREMEEYYVEISKSVPADFPVYLYNIPQCSTNDLKPATVERIAARCPNVVGIKYSYHDMLRVSEYLRVRGGDFSVVVGTDRLFFPALMLGCSGTVSGVSSVCPEPFVAIYDAVKKGDLDRAREMQKAAFDICDVLKNGANMAYFKSALGFRGVEGGHMRRPLMDLGKDESGALASAFAKVLEKYRLPLRA
jgi:4-hydroxy-tetrahydrodipicolinate synthase